MKIELTIKTSYLPGWGVFEGLRELLQNGRDAEVELNAPLKVTHANGTLRIENSGCTLPYEALLLGHTTKADRSELIGQYGEGLKLGILALIRAGRSVKIRSGSEVWTPFLTHSEKFNAEVLAFDIQKGREDKQRVRVEVGGVTESDWKDIQCKFLFLMPPKDKDVVKTYDGDLLLAEKHQGHVYVKGIYVHTNTQLAYGYDFKNIAIDRDRKMVNSWDVEYGTRKIWQNAVASNHALFNDFMALVEAGAPDVKSLDNYAAGYMDREIVQKALDQFVARYGKDAVPVKDMSESIELEHLGKKGVVVNQQLAAILGQVLDVSTIKKQLANEVVKTYSFVDLTEEEGKALAAATELLLSAGVVGIEDSFQVVDFRTNNIVGQYKAGEIFIAKKLLSDKHELLVTMVHEVCHKSGGDGEKGHVMAIENAWKAISQKLWK